jgi:predicted transcriptional regulator
MYRKWSQQARSIVASPATAHHQRSWIARRDHKPKPGEPKLWFTSMKSVAEVLSDSNRALLKIIRETEPQSVAELAKATGRQRSNLSRTLKTMSRYGLVDLRREKKNVRPIARFSDFQIQASA